VAVVVVAAAVALHPGAAVAGATAGEPPPISKSPIPVQIGGAAASRPVPPGFIGLSIEYGSAPAYFGLDPSRPDSVFMTLVRNLVPGQSPVIRFGGDTTDWTWWDTPGVAKPRGIRYTLGPSWVAATQAMAQALNARLILGINFEADRRAIAATEAQALLQGLGRRYVAGFELGNEAELYGTFGWYSNAAGVGVPGRPSSYDFKSYLRDYASVVKGLPADVPVIGPASGSSVWLAGLPRYLKAEPRVREVTFHRYPLHRCRTPRSSPAFPSIANLLSPAASSGLAGSLRAAVRVAHARGLPLRSDELNSVSCGGARGVSDTFASALWALDTLFSMARVGVDGVNIETFRNAIYEPFAFSDLNGVWSAQVRPLYYGLLMFARAAPPGSHLLPATYAAPRTLRVWATRAPGGPIRVVVLNDSRSRPVTVAVGGLTGATVATAESLTAPGADATGGITLGGQTFGAATTTGELTGAPDALTLHAIQGRFVISVAPATATLITLG
jgi:hypothetical protein